MITLDWNSTSHFSGPAKKQRSIAVVVVEEANIIMRRSKSNPAKYAKNYRKISQRRMTTEAAEEDNSNDQTTTATRDEIQRLEALLSRHDPRRTKNKEQVVANKDVDGPVVIPVSSSSPSSPSINNKRAKPHSNDSNDEGTIQISDELQDSYGASDVIVLPSRTKKQRRQLGGADAVTTMEQPVALPLLTKAEIKTAQKQRKNATRKLQQLQHRRDQREKRSAVYEKLQQHAVNVPSSLSLAVPVSSLLESSARLGQRKTTKELLRALLQRERAGLPLTEEERGLLYRRSSSSSSSRTAQHDLVVDDDEEQDAAAAATATTTSSTAVMPMDAQKPSEDSTTTHRDGDTDRAKPARSIAQQMMDSLSTLQQQDEFSSSSAHKKSSSLEDDLKEKPLVRTTTTAAANQKPYTPAAPIQIKTTQSYETVPPITPAILLSHQNDNDNNNAGTMLALHRPANVIASRATLPVVAVELEVMDSIAAHDVTIVSAETGSGKSTQIPQFILLSHRHHKNSSIGHHNISSTNNNNANNQRMMIAVTQPRRVAAISIAKRVAYELLGITNIPHHTGCAVAYQTRYETAGWQPGTTQLKFMTDGILLQEIQRDLLLRHYHTVILDEAHERNLNTDVLIGLLKLSLAVRNNNNHNNNNSNDCLPPLKVIVMSATLRIQDFTNVFPEAGLVQIPGRLHSVTIHHAKHTELDRYGK
jgi:DEAD/DEAH box helicase